MSFAVIESGGKQYRVSPGSIVTLEKLEQPAGEQVSFDKVLLYQDGATPQVGTPFIEGATVSGEVVAHTKGDKIRVFTYKPKKRQRRTLGHRQQLTQVKITGIEATTAKTRSSKKQDESAEKSN